MATPITVAEEPPFTVQFKDLGPKESYFAPVPEDSGTAVVTVELGDYEDQHFCLSNRASITLTVFVLISGLLLIWCFSPKFTSPPNMIYGEACYRTGYVYWIIIALALGFYVAYLIESCCSPTCGYLKSTKDTEGIHQHISRIKNVAPNLWFHIQCYHYETRTYTSTNSEGETTTNTETVRVDTFSETECFPYDAWDDISGEIKGLSATSEITRVRFSKCFVFADEKTRGEYVAAANSIQSRNRHRDTHMDFSSGFNVAGYRDRKLCFRDIDERPIFMRLPFFVLSSFMLFGYCYRSWFNSSSVKQRFQYVKRIQSY